MEIKTTQKLYPIFRNLAMSIFFSFLGYIMLLLISELNYQTSNLEIFYHFIALILLSVYPIRILIKDTLECLHNFQISKEKIVSKNIFTGKELEIAHENVKGFSLVDSYAHFLFFKQKLIFIYLSERWQKKNF